MSWVKVKDASLRDILVQSSVVAEWSMDLALSGKIYNRSIRAHNLMYESMIRIISESNNWARNEKITSRQMQNIEYKWVQDVLGTWWW